MVRGQKAKEWNPPVITARGAGTRGKLAAASRRERFRFCSFVLLHCVCLRNSRKSGDTTCTVLGPCGPGGLLKEAGQVLSVDFSGEVMAGNFAFAQAREFTD